MNVFDLVQKKVQLKKVSNTNGGEYQGPCPDCGGVDRFHVWPHQNEGRGSYWCRGCEKTGDNIQFLRDFEGLSFREACLQLNITLPDRPGSRATAYKKTEFQPTEHTKPADLWQEKAEKLVAWAQEKLDDNTDLLQWLDERGITRKMAQAYRLGWNPGENGKDIYRARKAWGLPEFRKSNGKLKALWIPIGLIIPYIIDRTIHRIRIRRPEGEPRYYVIPGSSMNTMILEPDRRAFVVVESELDAILISRYPLAGSVALGSVSAKPDTEAYQILKDCLQILVSLDFDRDGAKYKDWWTKNFPNCDRWPVPAGKDPGDAFKMGIDLEKWIETGLPPAMTIEDGFESRVPGSELKKQNSKFKTQDSQPVETLNPAIRELHDLLRKNSSVQIINTINRFTVLRSGKYVGGRISELVFKTPEVTEYIMAHPEEEIDGNNFILQHNGEQQCL